MLEDLFITDAPGANIGSSIELSDRIEDWPMEIQNIVVSQVPQLMDMPGELNFNAVDQDKLYAKGSYVVDMGSNSDDSIVFPVIVKSGKLLPIDLYIHRGTWHPLDIQELNSIMASPDMGEGLISDEEIPTSVNNNLAGRMNPPSSYGGGVVTSVTPKMAALNRSISDELIKSIDESLYIKGKLSHNKVARGRFTAVLDANPSEVKTASASCNVGDDSIIYATGRGMFSIKQASIQNGEVVSTHLECDGDQLATWIKKANLDAPRILDELKTRKMAFTWDDNAEVKDTDTHVQIEKTGKAYQCYRANDITPIKSAVVGKVASLTGDRYLTVNADNTYSLQSSIAGIPTEDSVAKTASLNMDNSTLKVGSYITVATGAASPTDPLELTIPAKIASITKVSPSTEDGYTSIVAEHSMGKYAFILPTNTKAELPIKTTHIPEGTVIPKLAEVWYLPTGYPIVQLPDKKQELIKSADDIATRLYLDREGCAPTVKASMWNIDKYSVGLKLGAAKPTIISRSDAMLLVKAANGGQALDSMKKLATGSITVLDLTSGGATKPKVLEPKTKDLGVNKASKKAHYLPKDMRVSTLKVAAVMEDEEDVDTVLALNYLTPENLMEFKDALPTLKDTENTLAKLLMSIRLGSPMSSEQDVKGTLDSLHNVISEIEMGM